MKRLLTLFALFCSLSATADTRAKIEKVLLYEQANLIYIYPEGGVTNPPACHGANGDYISYKMDRPMAKEYFSALLAAYFAQKNVYFRTAGDCIDQSLSETLVYFHVHN